MAVTCVADRPSGSPRARIDGTPDGGPWPPLTEGWPDAKEYRKTATVWAVRMTEAFEVHTLEGVMTGEPGDYLCQGPAGERWPVKRAIFEATYALAHVHAASRCRACGTADDVAEYDVPPGVTVDLCGDCYVEATRA